MFLGLEGQVWVPPLPEWRICSLLHGYWFMATFWLRFKFLICLRSFFFQKCMQSDWRRLGQGPVGGPSGSPFAGCWHLPGVSDCCCTGPPPRPCLPCQERGGAGLRPSGAHSGSRVPWPVIRSAVAGTGFVSQYAAPFINESRVAGT